MYGSRNADDPQAALKVGLITTDYPPQCTSAAVQMRDLAVEMVRQGHNPVVLVPTIDLGAPWKTELMEGVTVLRLPAPRTRDLSYLRRTLGEFALPFVMAKRLRRTPYAAAKWDLVAWYSPTIFFGPLVWFLKRTSRCRTYLILRDIFPEWALDLRLIRRGPAYCFFKTIATIQYAVADVIGVQTPSNLAYMDGWIAHGKRVEVLHNWQTPSPDVGTSIQIGTTKLAGRRILVYIGNMGVAQGMDILIDLARELASRDDLGFVFVGRGSEVPRLKGRVESHSLSNTLFFDEVDSSEMPGLLAQCDVGLLTLDPRHKSHNIPGKFLTYLRAGLPVVARVNPGTDLAHIIEEEKVGRSYDSEDVAPLSTLVEELIGDPNLYAEMSTRGRRLADRMFSSERAVRQIVSTAAC